MAADYYCAMAQVEKELKLAAESTVAPAPIIADARAYLLALASQLAEPNLRLEARLSLVEQIRGVLKCPFPSQTACIATTEL